MENTEEIFETIIWDENLYTISHWGDYKLSILFENLIIDGRKNNQTYMDFFLRSQGSMSLCVWSENKQLWMKRRVSEIPQSGSVIKPFIKPVGDGFKFSFGT